MGQVWFDVVLVDAKHREPKTLRLSKVAGLCHSVSNGDFFMKCGVR